MSKELYRKKQLQEMFAWEEGLPMDIVSISEADKLSGSPKQGDMIAVNPKDGSDMWLVAKQFFEDNYEAVLEAEPVDNETLSVEQEPVIWIMPYQLHDAHPFTIPLRVTGSNWKSSEDEVPLYTHPATNEVSGYPKPLKRLNGIELASIARDIYGNPIAQDHYEYANAIQDAIAEKNK